MDFASSNSSDEKRTMWKGIVEKLMANNLLRLWELKEKSRQSED